MSNAPDPRLSDAALHAAARIVDGFEDYNARFSDITRRARRRFERRDWRKSQADNAARIDLYDQCIDETLSRLESRLEERVRSRPLWREIRSAYATRIERLPDRELYKTFYNSLVRRFFLIDGVAADLEFLAFEIVPTGDASCPEEASHHALGRGLDEAAVVWRTQFETLGFANGWADLSRCDVLITCQGGDYTHSMHPRLRSQGWKGLWIDAASTGDSVSFSTDGSNFSYTPVPDGDGADAAITHVRFALSGAMSAHVDGVTDPSFSLTYGVIVE